MTRLFGSLRSYLVAALVVAACSLGSPLVEGASAGKIYVFNGKIQSVDAAARRFTLSGDGKVYAFRVTAETKISWRRKTFDFAILKAGQEAEVDMQVGAGGDGIAMAIKLASPWSAQFSGKRTGLSDAMQESLLAATTPSGKRLSAQELKQVALYTPRPHAAYSVIGYARITPGVFLLTVRPDGTVENVETLQSNGYKLADVDMIKALRQWRFRPNSVKEVRVPAQYGFSR